MGPEAKVLHVKQLTSPSDQASGKGLNERGEKGASTPDSGEVVEIIAAIDDDIDDQAFGKGLSEVGKTEADAPAQNAQDMRFSHMSLKHKLERAGTSYSLHKDMLPRDVETSASGTEDAVEMVSLSSMQRSVQQKIEPGSSASTANPKQMEQKLHNDASPGERGAARSIGKTSYTSAARKQQILRDNRSVLQTLHECCTKNQVNDNITYEILSLLRDDQQPIPDEHRSSFLQAFGKSLSKTGDMGTSVPVTPRDYLSLFMSRQISMSGGLDMFKKTTILIGPTGVGKTTTLAKLAAQYHLRQEKAVGLISIDAYRIAAIDQLKTYAQIMSVPFRVALTPEELDRCIDDYGDMDLILVDTPGRSQFNTDALYALGEFLEAAQPADTHLLIALSTKEEDAYAVAESFAPEFVRQVIFTKLDETSSFGSVLNIPRMIGKPVSYLTTGQNVPDDIEIAQVERMVDLFFQA